MVIFELIFFMNAVWKIDVSLGEDFMFLMIGIVDIGMFFVLIWIRCDFLIDNGL